MSWMDHFEITATKENEVTRTTVENHEITKVLINDKEVERLDVMLIKEHSPLSVPNTCQPWFVARV